MAKTEISDNIFWVGVIDWNVRDFHGYLTRRGTTYNAYLIKDEKQLWSTPLSIHFLTN